MPTIKQKRAFDKVVENGGNVSRAMMEVDYSPATAKTPQKLTDSDGWKQLCRENGLTEDFLVKNLIEDIKNKPQNRKPELELGFKVIGRLREKGDKGDTFNFIFNANQTRRIARRILDDNSSGEESSD